MSQGLPVAPPSIEMALVSRGVSKGLSQTDGPQAVVRTELPVGPFYVAGYAKNVTSSIEDGEAGLVAGVRTNVAGLSISASATWRIAINPGPGTDNQSSELAAAVSRKFGKFVPQLAIVWSPDDLGPTHRSFYYEANATYRLSAKTSLSAAIGKRDRVGGPNYVAFNAGITHKLNTHVSFDFRYYGSDKQSLGYIYQPGLSASVRVRF